MELTTFGKRLTEAPKAKKFSRDEFAKKLHVQEAVSVCYEKAEVNPSIETAAAIAEALEVSLDDLIGDTDLLLEKNVVKRIQDVQRLDTEEKEHVFALMDVFLRDPIAKKIYSR